MKFGIENRTLIRVNSLRDHSRIRTYSFGTLEKIRLSQAFPRFTISHRGNGTGENRPEGRVTSRVTVSTRNKKIILSL